MMSLVQRLTRSAAALLAVAALSACAQEMAGLPDVDEQVASVAPEQPEALIRPDWRDHFDDVSDGAILISIEGRWLAYWGPNGATLDVFPIAVPLNADLTRTGDTRVVRKRENPDWRPTPNMIERNPELPLWIGPGPQNPLGERAMYLGWTYYAIHGTNNPASIGTQATSGCFRMHPDDVLWLYDRVGLGVPVSVKDRVATRDIAFAAMSVAAPPSIYDRDRERAAREAREAAAAELEAVAAGPNAPPSAVTASLDAARE